MNYINIIDIYIFIKINKFLRNKKKLSIIAIFIHVIILTF